MRAIIHQQYGSPDVLQMATLDKPTPKENEVLVRIRATCVNPRDWHIMRGEPYVMRLDGFGIREPKHPELGSDLAGTVEAVGMNVTRFRPGDDVYAYVDAGAFAEYTAVPEDRMSPKPSNLTFEQAAAVPLAATTALQGLRNAGRLQPGDKVLIVGASGGVGTFAVQIAKELGAEVTGVCSTRNVELVRSLGADHVIDYTQLDFTLGERKYDLVFQLAGEASPRVCLRAVTPKGTLVPTSGDSKGRWIGPISRMFKAKAMSPFVKQRITMFLMHPDKDDFEMLTKLIEDRKVTPVIDRTYPLTEIPEAIRYLETGRARGKVVVTVNHAEA